MKLKQKILTLGALVGLSMNGFSQFVENYNSGSTTGWTYVPSTGSGYSVVPNFLYFTNIQGNFFKRMHKSLSPAIPTLTNYWRLDFSFQFDQNPATKGIANWLAVLTAGTQDMTCSSLAPSYTPTNQDHIGVLLQSPSATSPNNAVIAIGTKRGTTQAISTGIGVVPNTLYFVTLQRIGPGVLQMHVFSDAARTMPVAGSGFCFTTFDAATGTGGSALTTLQHGGVSWAGLDRTVTGAVDDIVLNNVDDPTQISADQLLCTPNQNPAIIGNTTTNYPGQFIGTYHWYKIPESGFPTGLSNTTMDYDPPVLTGTTSYNRTFDYGCGMITSNMVKITVPVFNSAIDCNIANDYSSTTGWTQTGTDVKVSPALYGEYKAASNSFSQKITRSIGNLPSDKWRVDFEFQYDPNSSFSPGAYIAAVTNDGSDPLSATQDIVFAGFGQMLSTGPSSTSNLYIWGGSRSDAALAPTYLTSTGITIIQGYGAGQINYVSLERTCPTTGRISVFTDAARTIHAPGSPQYFTIDANVGIPFDYLTTLQHANNIYYNTVGRTSLRVDNLCIDNNYMYGGHRMATSISEKSESTEMVNETFTVFPNPGTGIYTLSTEFIKDGLIEIFDVMGKKVQSIRVTAETPVQKIDLSGHSKGIYIVRLNSNNKVYSKKIILE